MAERDDTYDLDYRMKVCTKCKRQLPLEEFSKRSDQGVSRRRKQCKECVLRRTRIAASTPQRRAAAAKHGRRRRDERVRLLAEIKLESGCMDCGYKEHRAALDFDHRPGTEKLFNIMSDGMTRSLDSVMEEVAKCDVVCANCHRIRTWKRQNAEEILDYGFVHEIR